MPWRVLYFQSSNKRYPVKEFVESVDNSTSSRIVDAIFKLNRFGPFIQPPFSKKITKDLYELRIKSRITVRIFYCFYKNDIYLLEAFKKKSQKTPRREIKKALDRMKQLI